MSAIGPASGGTHPRPAGPGQDDDASLTIRTALLDGTFSIALHGELDIATAEEAEQEVRRAEASSARRIVLDLSGLRFIDSTGIRLVFGIHARTRESGRTLSLLPGPANVQRAFEVCGLADALPFAR